MPHIKWLGHIYDITMKYPWDQKTSVPRSVLLGSFLGPSMPVGDGRWPENPLGMWPLEGF